MLSAIFGILVIALVAMIIGFWGLAGLRATIAKIPRTSGRAPREGGHQPPAI